MSGSVFIMFKPKDWDALTHVVILNESIYWDASKRSTCHLYISNHHRSQLFSKDFWYIYTYFFIGFIIIGHHMHISKDFPMELVWFCSIQFVQFQGATPLDVAHGLKCQLGTDANVAQVPAIRRSVGPDGGFLLGNHGVICRIHV